MESKALFFLFSCVSVFVYSQTTEIYFKYDDSGNQRYRGIDSTASVTNLTPQDSVVMENKPDTDPFWDGVWVYPIPVKDYLNIDWSGDTSEMISQVSLFEHSRVNFVFRHQKMASDHRLIRIDMTGLYPGVYILSFELKDGTKMTRNIIKQ